MRTLVFTLAAAITTTIVPTAFAQSPASDDPYGYRFDDDYMVGDTLGSPPPSLRVRKYPLKVQLIRPRVSFVGEMLKSVEAL